MANTIHFLYEITACLFFLCLIVALVAAIINLVDLILKNLSNKYTFLKRSIKNGKKNNV